MQAAFGASSPIQRQPSDEKVPPLEVVGTIEIKKDDEESDVDARKVPEMAGRASSSGVGSAKPQGGGSSARKRGVAPAEKEHKRMKRLLRNRVSAQQARERKKAYLVDLETKTKDLEHRNAELEERVSTLQRENFMLRQIVKNTAIKNSASTGGSGMES